jgi:hypothetical protein
MVLSVLAVNLLIAFLSDTFTRVYEQRNKANFTEMVKIIHDLESLWIFGSYSDEKRAHLIYADAIKMEDQEDDISIGIGQKVSDGVIRIKTHIDAMKNELRNEQDAKMDKRFDKIEAMI